MIASGAFCLSLIAHLPAAYAAQYVVLPPGINHVSGTLWTGRAELDPGFSLGWRLLPGESLRRFALVADVAVSGPQTDLHGQAAIGAKALSVLSLSGPFDWRLAAALAPGLPVTCSLAATVADLSVSGIAWRGGSAAPPQAAGRVQSGTGSCSQVGGTAAEVPVPPLTLTIAPDGAASRAVLAASAAPDAALAEAEITADARLIVTVHPLGAALVPGMPASGDSSLEFPLSALIP